METALTTREATRQYRLQRWQAIFHDRIESGLSVKDYCQTHSITKDSYYYWQKIAREAAIAGTGPGPVFAELKPGETTRYNTFIPQITVQIGSMVLGANSETPEDLLLRAVKILKYAE